MKIKTALLAIFLTLTHLTLSADAGTVSDTAPQTLEADNSNQTDTTQPPSTLPDSKYVTEMNENNAPKKDNSRLYNFLLALVAVAVATTAIILVSSNKGKHAQN